MAEGSRRVAVEEWVGSTHPSIGRPSPEVSCQSLARRASVGGCGSSSSVQGVATQAQADEPDTAPSTDASSVGGAPTPRSTASRVARWLLVTLGLWLLVAGYLVFDSQRHARNAEDSLRRVADITQGDLSGVDFATVQTDLAAASKDLSAGRRSIMSPVVRILGPVPIVGRQLAVGPSIDHDLRRSGDALTPLGGIGPNRPGRTERSRSGGFPAGHES